MDKKRIERQEVMVNAGNLQNEIEEIKKFNSQSDSADELFTEKFGPLLTLICC